MAIFQLEQYKPTVSDSAWVAESAQVIGAVRIAEQASIWPGAVLRGDLAGIEIGPGSNVQDNAVLHTDQKRPCSIGAHVTVGHSAVIHSATVHEGALIGMGAIVLNGAVIGQDAVVGAGALVPEGKIVPARALVVGTPARFVRTLTDEEVAVNRANTLHYERTKERFRTALVRVDVPATSF